MLCSFPPFVGLLGVEEQASASQFWTKYLISVPENHYTHGVPKVVVTLLTSEATGMLENRW
jgi:hypothetical protein